MTVTFHNVTISLEAEEPGQAYDELCALLDSYDRAHGGGAIEWATATYSIDNSTPRDTRELWPQPGDPRETVEPDDDTAAMGTHPPARIVIYVDGGVLQFRPKQDNALRDMRCCPAAGAG